MKKIKILHVCQSDIEGGAARAAYRIHIALLNYSIQSEMLVNIKLSKDETVLDNNNIFGKISIRIKSYFSNKLKKLLKTENKVLHTPALFGSNLLNKINKSNADIINLHWLGGETLSIVDVSKINKPIVWTLHDMWAFCGAEHYTDNYRWKDGYTKKNRPDYERGLDLNKIIWDLKIKFRDKNITIIGPSKWITECAKTSILFKENRVLNIPYCIDIDKWKPIDKVIARNILNLPINKKIIIFGAIGGARDLRKGYDLLDDAINKINNNEIELIIFGQRKPFDKNKERIKTHYFEHLYDSISLQILYSSADCFVLPSRLDNLPNTGIEAHSCGVPIAAFNVGGIPDIVDHLKTGYLAKCFDTNDLAYGISWIIDNEPRNFEMRINARNKIVNKFNELKVSKEYLEVYNSIF